MVEGRTHRMTEMIARLAPGATVAQARSEVQAAYAPHAAGSPGRVRPRVALPGRGHPLQGGAGRAGASLTLWLLMGAAAFVLIISAANVANLTLMRGVRREHELVVRAALGAGVARLRRLLLVENLMLTLAGAALGARARRRRRPAADVARRAVLAARERDPPRRRGAGLHARAVGGGRAAALVPGLAADGGTFASWIAGANARERKPARSSGCSARSSSSRSRSRSCCSPAPDCSPAR